MHGHAKSTKGKKESPTYNSWRSMVQRCTNKNHKWYWRYSPLGFDSRWVSFENFLEDMGVRPLGRTLERVDNEAGYSKSNCIWATKSEQQKNRRVTVLSPELAQSILLLRSSGLMIREISAELGIHRSTITNVLYRGDWL